MNFCINCIHFRPSRLVPADKSLARCARKIEYDRVTGEENLAYCSMERMSMAPCGHDGRHFQPARTPDFRDFQTTPLDALGGDLTTSGAILKQGD